MYLGIEKDEGRVYAGGSTQGMRPVFPPPYLFDMQIAGAPAEALKKLIAASDNIFAKLLFREDGFDPITMVRRGRVYELPQEQGQPQSCTINPFNEVEAWQYRMATGSNGAQKTLNVFTRFSASVRICSDARYAAIGNKETYSLWRIVSIERMYTDEELLTLRPVYSMGALPDLDLSGVSEPWKSKVEETVRKVVDAIKLASADSIIDHCRNAASASLFACFHKDLGQFDKDDLGSLAKRAGTEGRRVVESCGQIIANLHSRIKPNIQVQHGCRIISDRDAELAICCLSCILSDLGYAKPT